VIAGFGRGVSEFRQLPTFRDNLSVLSAKVKQSAKIILGLVKDSYWTA
jgi:hypothetical protein